MTTCLVGALLSTCLLGGAAGLGWWGTSSQLARSARRVATAEAASTAAVAGRQSAEEQARAAFARELAARAASLLPHDPDLSLLLAAESVRVTYSLDHTYLP